MKKLIKILRDIEPDVNYETCQDLIDGRILDSFSILELIAQLEETFSIRVSPGEITAENFNSAQAIWNMIERLEKN